MRTFMQKLSTVARNHETPHVEAIAEDGDLTLELGKEKSVQQVMTCMLINTSPVFDKLFDQDHRKALPLLDGVPMLSLPNVDVEAMGTLCRMLHLKPCQRPNTSAKLATLATVAVSYDCLAAIQPHLRLWLREHVARGSDARSRNPTCLTHDMTTAYLLTDHDEFQRATSRLVLCHRGRLDRLLRSTRSAPPALLLLPPDLHHVLERKRLDVQTSLFLSLRKLLQPLTRGRAHSFREDRAAVAAGLCAHERLLQRALDLESAQTDSSAAYSILEVIARVESVGVPELVEWSDADRVERALRLRECFKRVTDGLRRVESSGLCLLGLKCRLGPECEGCGRNVKKRKRKRSRSRSRSWSVESGEGKTAKIPRRKLEKVGNGMRVRDEEVVVDVREAGVSEADNDEEDAPMGASEEETVDGEGPEIVEARRLERAAQGQ